MAEMGSSSRDTLLQLFDEVIEWKKTSQSNVCFNWTPNHLSAVRRYVSKTRLKVTSDITLLPSAELLRNSKDPKMVAYFTQELRTFFTVVPTLGQLFQKDTTLKKNELIAAFINFLLQLLHHKTDFVLAFEDRIRSLENELRFLVTVLGDKILVCDEHEQVRNLLTEIEAVADEAGTLLHSFFFSVDPVFQLLDEALDNFLEHTHSLKFSITVLSVMPPVIANKTPKITTVDSIFIADSLLYDLDHLLKYQQDNSQIIDVKGQIGTLHQELTLSLSLLKELKVPPHLEMEELKEADIRVRDVAYEAEFLIGSFLLGDAPLWYFSIRIPHVIHKIKLIGTELQEIKHNGEANLGGVTKSFGAQLSLEAKRSPDFDDVAVGFDDKAAHILEQLVGGSEQLQITSIFGMPGLGKTTFAKKLFAHPLVYCRFDRCSWSVVSQTYHRRGLLTDILIGLSIELDQNRMLNMDEESLVEHIYKTLKGRRYLIVMDDIWDSNAWYDVGRCFPDDGNGSRILLTTRNRDVGPPGTIIHELPFLSDEQCWELLEKTVFGNKPCPMNLQGIAKEIAVNCCGLPLVVVVISGILSTMEKEENAWREVGQNVASYISLGGNNFTMQILEFSYENLPERLKPCFLYLGVFPEDKEISFRKLTRLWIAQGFIDKHDKKNSAEDLAEEYLMELIDRSLVIVSERRPYGGVKSCIVHDLLRELCLRKGEEENFLRLVVEDDYSIYERGQHVLSLGSLIAPFGQHVRSFHGKVPEPPFYVVSMTSLRVMGFNWPLNPSRDLFGIEFMFQLRYLVINDFPPSIGSLVNLEYLLVLTCHTQVITSKIMRMTKLRYVHITHQAKYDESCYSDTSHTNNIQSLSNIVLYKPSDREMLKRSPHIRKLKCECKPWHGEDGVYQYPDLRFLSQLESVSMTTFYGPHRAEVSFPATVRKLTISGLGLPWEMMSAIGGMPNLEILRLKCGSFVGKKWETKEGEFEKLRFLMMYKLELDEWNVESSEHFPKLQRLVLYECYNLEVVPNEIGDIGTLQFIEIRGWCLKTLVESAVRIEEEQRDMGNEDLRVVSS
ncbi:PREDICTED: putative late blight resistance protein homolog R1A-3 [Erythranthe guttata]|nr:PREDICTED: putative late blight resistance protein homolog R1A-3 [Erythranthe guttata]|eukprot:XP_012841251.1 PREDICTED: putative late blight resistance protein homolog R1A-3 [Erythranthe guttata]